MSPSIEMYRNLDIFRNFKCTWYNKLNILKVCVFIKFRLRRKWLTSKKSLWWFHSIGIRGSRFHLRENRIM